VRERTRREDVVIATRGGLRMEGDHLVRDASGRWPRAGVEASLRSLGTDYIDIYQVHWPDLHTPPEETAEALGELVREGKIRHAGVSNYDVDQIAALGRYGRVETLRITFTAFIYGGTLGVLGASLLEAEFLKQPTAGTYVYVGLIEEAVKLGALWLIARRLPRYTMRDGIVLGAAVGFGFAALESAGYAFNALFTLNGLSLTSLVETEVLRGILAPVGHGLWTAILGGAVFATAARHGRPRLTGGVVGWYLLVAALHTLWDSSQAIAVWLTLLLTGTQVQWLMIQLGRIPVPTQAQVHLYTALNWTLLFVDALIGLLVLRRRWRRATATDPPLEVEPPTGAGVGVGAGPGVGV